VLNQNLPLYINSELSISHKNRYSQLTTAILQPLLKAKKLRGVHLFYLANMTGILK